MTALQVVGDRVLAGTTGGLLISLDHGLSWSPWGTSPVPGIAALADGGGRRYAAGAAGCFELDEVTGGVRPLLSGAVAGIAVFGELLVAATPLDGIVRSTDGGQNWTGASAGLRSLKLMGLAAGVTGNPFVLAAAGDGVYRSEGSLIGWRRVLPWSGGIDSVSVSGECQRCLAVGSDGTLHVSHDRGRTWGVISSPAPVTAAGFVDSDGQRLLVGATGAIYEVGRDGDVIAGAGVSAPILAVATLGERGPHLAGLHRAGLVRWAGEGLEPVDVQARLVAHGSITVQDDASTPVLVTSGIDDVVERSLDGGETWAAPITEPAWMPSALDVSASGRLVLGGETGDVLITDLHGAEPTTVRTGGPVTAVGIAPGIGGLVLVGVSARQVVRIAPALEPEVVLEVTGDGEVLAIAADREFLARWVVVMRARGVDGTPMGVALMTDDDGDQWAQILELSPAPSEMPVIEARAGWTLIGWGTQLHVVGADGVWNGAPDGSIETVPAGTISALASRVAGGRCLLATATERGVAMAHWQGPDATTLVVQHADPGPLLALALTEQTGRFVEAWAIDMHGQAWSRATQLPIDPWTRDASVVKELAE